jgi:hypothetical protein
LPLDQVYGRHLFHGPEFAAICALEGIASDAAVATLVGSEELGWPGSFLTDPALLDGGLQLACLWTSTRMGRTSLPTAIGSLVIHRRGRARGPVCCVLAVKQATRDRMVSDVRFVDQGGVVAELHDVEMHFLADAAAA